MPAKPVVVLVGANKGGVGKTTVARTLIDYLSARGVQLRAFDTEFPRGGLKRFHPKLTEVVDITTAADQMKIIDTLATSEAKINVIDVRAGALLDTLKTFTQVGFFELAQQGEFGFMMFHVIGPSIDSLEEMSEVMTYTNARQYFVVKNFINETNFFEWQPELQKRYSRLKGGGVEITMPKLNEMAFEQSELAGVPISTFIANRNAEELKASYSLVLRGYVSTWLRKIINEYDRVHLLERLAGKTEGQ